MRLTSPVPATRRTVLQKVRGCTLVLPQLVNIGFQVLFHSPPGVLFTFPSQYYALSVTEEYLALGGGPPDFPQGFPCLVVLRILPAPLCFAYGSFTLSGRLSQYRSARIRNTLCSPLPRDARIPVWALPLSLAATQGIVVTFSSSGYLDVSVPRVPFRTLWIHVRMPVIWRVSPFRNLWIKGYLLLPRAYRSLSRLSSALSA